jgi:hypothetical protein
MDESFKSISGPRVLDDGKRVAFTVERQDGKTLRVTCPTTELGEIISFLALIGVHASENAPLSVDRTPGAPLSMTPIPAFGLGFAHGQSPDETFLLVNLRGFQLEFQIPSSGLIRLADDVSRIARTLAADSSKEH